MNISASALPTFLKDNEKIQVQVTQCETGPLRKRIREALFHDVDSTVYARFTDVRA